MKHERQLSFRYRSSLGNQAEESCGECVLIKTEKYNKKDLEEELCERRKFIMKKVFFFCFSTHIIIFDMEQHHWMLSCSFSFLELASERGSLLLTYIFALRLFTWGVDIVLI